MMNGHVTAAAFVLILPLWHAAPSFAQGATVVTQASAQAGDVTPGDAPGFPVTISQPGPYILGSHLTVPAGKIGIEVESDFVDIDMNGFSLIGSGVASSGVRAIRGRSRIHDGYITSFAGGIVLDPAEPTDWWVIEDMQIVFSYGGSGVTAFGSQTRILDSTIAHNVESGLRCGRNCYIAGNSILSNGLVGIDIVSGLVLGNTIFDNGAAAPNLRGFGILDSDAGGDTGFGNNVIARNNKNGPQVSGVAPLQPNACVPDCPIAKKKK